MLSIAPMSGAGQGEYYLSLAKEDYYLEGGEPPGRWLGDGAKRLGLEGEVRPEELRSMLQGAHPITDNHLVQNAYKENRQSGWDLTFSAPKSVSVAWSQADPTTRKAIEAAHDKAVGEALSYLECEAGVTRRGKGGVEKEEASLSFAVFQHGTSRAQDPALHSHALLINVGVRDDGSTGTLESTHIFTHKMAAGAVYRAELSAELSRSLGMVSERHKTWFELKGVPEPLTKEFSQRRASIEAHLQETGFSGAKASKVATLATRSTKEHVPRESLFSSWQDTGKEHNWSTKEVAHLCHQAPERSAPEKVLSQAMNETLTGLTSRQSHFTKRDIVRGVAENCQATGVGARDVRAFVASELSQNSELVSLGMVRGEARFTTKTMLALEEKMLTTVQDSKQARGAFVAESTLQKSFSRYEGISDEQQKGVCHLTQERGSIRVVSGMAGTGKSYMLGAARDALEAEGYTVKGAALSGKAAQGLQDGSGISSETLHKTLYDIEEGRLSLNERSVLVVDEAGMVGTSQMEALTRHTTSKGATLLLIGDARQLQPIEAGGAFKAIAAELGEVSLTDIRRQEAPWAREMIHSFADGRADKGLEALARQGNLHVAATPEGAKERLLSDWKEEGVRAPGSHLMLAGTNQEARSLNREAQKIRFRDGALGKESLQVAGGVFFGGDRVLFTRNSRMYGVRNGQLGTVSGVDARKGSMEVTLDDGKNVSFSPKDYEHIKLGYAVTTHKAQGMTTDNAYILAGGSMQDRELSYVQVSRAKENTKVYTDVIAAGEEVKDLARQMGKSHQKELASDLYEKGREQRMEFEL